MSWVQVKDFCQKAGAATEASLHGTASAIQDAYAISAKSITDASGICKDSMIGTGHAVEEMYTGSVQAISSAVASSIDGRNNISQSDHKQSDHKDEDDADSPSPQLHQTESTVQECFSIDGCGTKLCERLPGVGFVASAVHAIAGNFDHATRAAATCTNTTVTAIGAVTGGLLGGAGGALLGGRLMSVVGQASEVGVACHVKDEEVRATMDTPHTLNDVVESARTTAPIVARTVLAKTGLPGAVIRGSSVTS